MKKYIDWHGCQLYCQAYGRPQRNTLVLLHGYCEDLSIWHHLLPALKSMRVILIDLPGFGKSEPLNQNASIDAYTEAVAHVLDTLKVKQVVMLGHSLGGYITLRFADRYPAMLSGFGLMNSHPFADAADRRDARNKSIQLIKDGGKKTFVRQLIPGLFRADYADKDRMKELVKTAAKGPDAGIIHAAEAMRDRPDQTEVLISSAVPVLFLLGVDDHLVTRPMRDAFMHLPNIGQLEVLDRVAHMAMFEAPEQTTLILQAFVHLCQAHRQKLAKIA